MKKDLPVGLNLQDHIMTPAVFMTDLSPTTELTLSESVALSFKSLVQYLVMGSGPLASAALEVSAFTKSGLQNEEDPRPDLQMISASYPTK